MTATSYYQSSDYSSDDSSDWSDSPRTKRKTTRKTKSSLSRKASAKGSIRKAKKPGRKPLETFDELPSDPKLKRKVQNRAAQRAFRERKEQYVVELQGQLKELEEATTKREKELQKDIAKLKRENEKLKEDMDNLKKMQQFPPDTEKSNPTSSIFSPPTSDVILSPEQIQNDSSFYSSDLSDYQGSTPMTDSYLPEYNDPLQSIFGSELDLFGSTLIAPPHQEQLDPFFVEQMQALTEQDPTMNEKPCKKSILYLLSLAKGADRKLSQLDEDFKLVCPNHMDHLCNELRKRIQLEKNHILTDEEVDLYIECIQRTP